MQVMILKWVGRYPFTDYDHILLSVFIVALQQISLLVFVSLLLTLTKCHTSL